MHIILGGLNLPRPGSNSVNSVLLSVISNMGFTYSYEGVGDIFLNLDHSKRCLDNWNAKNEESKPKVLIRLETESVFPMQYSLKIESRYSKVYTLGTFDKSFSKLELGFPYGPTINHCNQSESLNFIEVFNQNKEDEIYSTANWNDRPKNVVFIGTNKILPKDNLYAVRRSFIRQELKNFSLELYGDLWIKARFKRMKYLLRISLYLFKTRTPINPFRKLSWVFEEYAGAKGVVKDKLHLLKQSKFNLIIENSSDFVTEKLFDAILCGTIPIYLGPVFHRDPLLEKALIRVTEAELLGSNLELIIQRSGYSVESILESMTQLMSSGQFVERWTAKGVFHSLLNDLVQYLKSVPIRVI